MNERLDLKAQNDNRIMTVLRLNSVSHEIAVTDRGHLRLTLNKGDAGKDYKFVLDAVPVDPKVNKELLELFIDIICPVDVEAQVLDLDTAIQNLNENIMDCGSHCNNVEKRVDTLEDRVDELASQPGPMNGMPNL